jgi:hypothetical protein
MIPKPKPPPLTGAQQRTYHAIFEHPVWSNLCWHEVRSLFRHLGQTETQPDGSVKVTRRGQSLLLHPPHYPDVATTDEIKTLREFLERTESAPATEAKPRETG